MTASSPLTALAAAQWRERADAHLARARRHTLPARHRRERGLPHPTADFLFEYYPFAFSLLEWWQPGSGVALEWNPPADGPALPPGFSPRWYEHRNGRLWAEPGRMSAKETQRLKWLAGLLEATLNRPPNFACHGLHEWAMVYRGRTIRHEKNLPPRLPQQEVDALVESRPICCSHFDAFRFFAPEARPLNTHQPTLDTRILLEQPGCLHANMDLYKWAAKAMPWVGSDLLLDCFELAVDLRDLDMRASPYDLSGWGREAVPVETPEGRRQYEAEQKSLAARARPLRQRLIEALRAALDAAGAAEPEMR
jgi:hypothetical protein